MSLKSIGELGKYASLLKGFASIEDVLGADSDVGDAFDFLTNKLKDLTVDEASEKLKNLKLNPNLSKDILESAKSANILKGTTEEIENGIKKMGKSSSYIDDLALGFS